MAASGHKSTSAFKRYNLVTEEELSRMIWLEDGTLETTMDTIQKKDLQL